MIGGTADVRAVFLAGLAVLSVIAGSVALAGPAATDHAPARNVAPAGPTECREDTARRATETPDRRAADRTETTRRDGRERDRRGASAPETPTRTDVADDRVVLKTAVQTQERGDVVVLKFAFGEDVERARVTLGAAERVGFEVRFAIRDTDDDGEVVVRWNTARSAAHDAGLSVKTDCSGWREDEFARIPYVVASGTEPVEPATYPISVVSTATGTETDVGTVVIEERSSERLTVHTAPASVASFETVRAVERATSNATADDTIAVGERATDWVVLRLAASGLAGYTGDVADFDDDADGVTLSITEADATADPNRDPVSLRLDGNATLLADGPDDVYYVAFDAAELLAAGAEVGDRFIATFAVEAANNVTETNETLSASFSLVRGRASVDLQDGDVVAGVDEAARVTGTSTWAPGTNLLVLLRSSDTSGGGEPFLARNDSVVVGPNGTWTVTFDLSAGAEGQRVHATLFHVNTSVKLASVSGTLGRPTAAVAFADQVAGDGGTLVVVDSVTLERGGFVVVREGGPTGPIVGTSRFLDPGAHENVRIRLDVGATVTDETRLVAVAHLDTDDDRAFDFAVTDGAVDGPYTAGGSPVASAATVRASPSRATAIPPPASAGERRSGTANSSMILPMVAMVDVGEPASSTGLPFETLGVGPTVALAALVASALLAVRRVEAR